MRNVDSNEWLAGQIAGVGLTLPNVGGLGDYWPHAWGIVALVAAPLIAFAIQAAVVSRFKAYVDGLRSRFDTEMAETATLGERLGAGEKSAEDNARLLALHAATVIGAKVEEDPIEALRFVSDAGARVEEQIASTLNLVMIGAGSSLFLFIGALSRVELAGGSRHLAIYAVLLLASSLACSFLMKMATATGAALNVLLLGMAVRPPVEAHTREVAYRLLRVDPSNSFYEKMVGMLSYSAIVYLFLGFVTGLVSIISLA